MTAYVVRFERIGRNREVPDLTATASSADELAAAVYQYARGKTFSQDLEVELDLGSLVGNLYVGGFRNAGSFTIEPTSAGGAR